MKVDVAHISFQTQDTESQKAADADVVFGRERLRGAWWITGTEANKRAESKIYRDAARAHGFDYYGKRGDVWVALDPSRVSGRVEREWTAVIPGVARRHPERGVLRVSFDSSLQLGRISVLVTHYNLARGSGPSDNPKLAREIAKQARAHGRGSALVFYGGDQNINDKRADTFLGAPLTSAWDELHKHDPTHDRRTIDVIASYNADSRVSATYCRALDDSELRLHTDHFLVEAGYDVAPLMRKKTP